VVKALIAGKKVNHPFLGVRPDEITPQLVHDLHLSASTGALLIGVDPGSPAAAAGLRPGDIIVSFAGQAITSVDDFYVVLRNFAPGDRVTIGFVRNGTERTTQAVLTLPPP
jgi:S1-C subfamily serine protease